MEDKTSNSSTSDDLSSIVVDRGPDRLRMQEVLSFAKHYSKLQLQINDIKKDMESLDNEAATCFTEVEQKIELIENKIGANEEEIFWVRCHLSQTLEKIEEMQQDISQLKTANSRHEEAERFLKNIKTTPRP